MFDVMQESSSDLHFGSGFASNNFLNSTNKPSFYLYESTKEALSIEK